MGVHVLSFLGKALNSVLPVFLCSCRPLEILSKVNSLNAQLEFSRVAVPMLINELSLSAMIQWATDQQWTVCKLNWVNLILSRWSHLLVPI